MKASITIKFPVELDVDGHGYSYVSHESIDGISCYACGPLVAKRKLRGALVEHIDQALARDRARTTMIFCKDGTILVVRFIHGSWGYQIVSSDRLGGSSSSNHDEFETIEYAVKHAEIFGGVVNSHSFY